MNNSNPLVVGDGTNAALLVLRYGSHRFGRGLVIASNSAVVASGTIVGGITNHGRFSLDETQGFLRLNGNLLLQTNSSFLLKVGGMDRGTNYDLIDVTNSVVFGGGLQVQLTGNFRPSWSNEFAVMQYRVRSREFAHAPNGQRLDIANGPGSFRVHYRDPNLILTDFRLDGNGDGIDDAWAMHYFGADFLPDGIGVDERLGDKDGDGLTNYEEYAAGTDPRNPLSTLNITFAGLTGLGHVIIDFQCVSNRIYGIHYSPGMSSWSSVASATISNPKAGTCR